MARPKKSGLDYFPFDVGFFDDPKIACIGGEFGVKGELTAVKLLCAIYRNGYFALWDNRLQMALLRQLPGVSAELLNLIVHRLVKWGFYEQSLFDTAKVLTSRGIQQRYFEATSRRIYSNGELPYLLVDVGRKPISVCRNGVSDYINSTKGKESKLNNLPIPPVPPMGESAQERQKRFTEAFLAPENFGALEQYCMSASLDDKPPFPILRQYVAEVSNQLLLEGNFPRYESDWRRSVMNLTRAKIQRMKYEPDSRRNQTNGGSKVCPAPGHGILRRPNTDA